MTELFRNSEDLASDQAAESADNEAHPAEAFIIRPLGDRIIVRRPTVADKTKGGIYIPDQAKEVPLEGTVVAIGDGRWLESGTLIEIPIEVGDRVMYSRYSGSEIKIQGETLLILNTSDVQAVYNWDPPEEENKGHPLNPSSQDPNEKGLAGVE